MSCFNEFALTVQVKHKIKSTQIPGFILIWLYFTTGHSHSTHVYFAKNVAYIAFNSWLSFSDCVVFCGDLAVSKLHQASRRCPAMTALCRRGRSELAGKNADESTWRMINCTELYKSIQLHQTLITPSPIGQRSIVMSVCVCLYVCVCPRSYLRNYISDLHQTFMRVTYGRRSVLLCRRYVMYFRFYGQIDR